MANGDMNIHTGGGASTGDVRAGGDFVGRDQTNIILNLQMVGEEFIKYLVVACEREQVQRRAFENELIKSKESNTTV